MIVPNTATRSAVSGDPIIMNAVSQPSAISSSTAGYWMEIRSLHPRQRPPSAIQLTSGMFSYHVMGRWHRGHRERGATTESSIGQREMHTLRNEPMTAPRTKISGHQIAGGKPCGAAPAPIGD